ncbi:hypothetical protein MSPP1_002337 [Malassezia sp. CBS 17886]|nr:hypothetical protein MSPP1_002337 [Malassezia sp. CBS 17886]
MTGESQSSISFILGLDQFQDTGGAGIGGSPSGTSQLLAGLNTLSPRNSENAEDAVSNFANQLSVWTNASFNFDGPMGHALIGDDEKDDLESGGDQGRRVDDEERVQRYFAASGAHSNAARDKNREADADALSNAPFHPTAPSAAPGGGGPAASFASASGNPIFSQNFPEANAAATASSSHLGAFPVQEPSPWRPGFQEPPAPVPQGDGAPPGMGNGQEWDLTSTLALQYLLSKSPASLTNAMQRTNTPAPPSWAGPTSDASPVSNNAQLLGTEDPMHVLQTMVQAQPPVAQPSVQDGPSASTSALSASEAHIPRSVGMKKKRSSSLASRSVKDVSEDEFSDGAEEAANDRNGYSPTRLLSLRSRAMAGHNERTRLVDTGNPEADAEANRSAIEEDKRRRNTAASARFRVKKKQREAALENSARDLEARVQELKQQNDRLRTENDWLRRLVTTRPEGLSALLNASIGHTPPNGVQPAGSNIHAGGNLQGDNNAPGRSQRTDTRSFNS